MMLKKFTDGNLASIVVTLFLLIITNFSEMTSAKNTEMSATDCNPDCDLQRNRNQLRENILQFYKSEILNKLRQSGVEGDMMRGTNERRNGVNKTVLATASPNSPFNVFHPLFSNSSLSQTPSTRLNGSLVNSHPNFHLLLNNTLAFWIKNNKNNTKIMKAIFPVTNGESNIPPELSWDMIILLPLTVKN